jgi:hypothetical protein
MQYRYIYKNKITGRKIYLNEKSNDKNLEIVMEIKGSPINEDKIIKKDDR